MDAWIIRVRKSEQPFTVSQLSDSGEERELEIFPMGCCPPGAMLVDVVQDLIDKGRVHLVLDVAEVARMDSSAIAEIARALSSARDEGASMVLANLSPNIRSLLRQTNLEDVIPTFGSVSEALASF